MGYLWEYYLSTYIYEKLQERAEGGTSRAHISRDRDRFVSIRETTKKIISENERCFSLNYFFVFEPIEW